MKSSVKATLISISCLLIIIVLLFAVGILSKPRNYSAPPTTIKTVDQNGAPISNLEVSRSWHDNDLGIEGIDSGKTDQNGLVQFPTVPANVGLFTGFFKKAISSLGSCGSGSGTGITISIRYAGNYEVGPKDKILHPTGKTYQDSDGVTFYTSIDDASNTVANLSFPSGTTSINYILSSKHFAQ